VNIRTLLVDDEELARRGLRIRLERAGDIAIVGECANGREAITAIARLAPDLVFLDVQMPEVSGFDVIEAVGVELAARIIFVTAFDQYAVRAFEVHALDYLLKPIDDERLAQALQRAREALSSGRDGGGSRLVSTVTRLNQAAERLAIPSGDRVLMVRVGDIDWLEASGNYVSVHVGKKSWLLRETIVAMEHRLAPHGFARIHRSTVINIERVAELRSLSNGEYAVVLHDGSELKLSRSYRHVVEALAGGGI
jgi:two-component system, LytTR family, response regulator